MLLTCDASSGPARCGQFDTGCLLFRAVPNNGGCFRLVEGFKPPSAFKLISVSEGSLDSDTSE